MKSHRYTTHLCLVGARIRDVGLHIDARSVGVARDEGVECIYVFLLGQFGLPPVQVILESGVSESIFYTTTTR